MPKEKEESIFYVGVKDPIEIRRSILESSKEMLQYLQRYEKFKEVRHEKAAQIAKLKEAMAEINRLVRKLKLSLPKTGLRGKIHKEESILPPKKETKKKSKSQVPKEVQRKIHVEVEKPKEMSELEKLEAELGEIEGRLSRLA